MQSILQSRSVNPTPVKLKVQFEESNGDVSGILSVRREKFHISIRKKDRENIFSKKRLILKMKSTIVDEGQESSYVSASQCTTQDLVDNLMYFHESGCQSYYILDDVYQRLDSYSEGTEEKFYYEISESPVFNKHLELVLQSDFNNVYYRSYLRFLNNCLYLCPETVLIATTKNDQSYDPTLLMHINRIIRQGPNLSKMIPDALHTLELLLKNPQAGYLQFTDGLNLFDPDIIQELQLLKLQNRDSYLSNVSKIIHLFKDQQDKKPAVKFLSYLTEIIKTFQPDEEDTLFKSYSLLQLGFQNLNNIEIDEIIDNASRFFKQDLPFYIKKCKNPKLSILMLEVYQFVIPAMLTQTIQTHEFEELLLLLEELYDVYSEPKLLKMIAETVEILLNQIYDNGSYKINNQIIENIWHQFERNIFNKSLSLAQVPFIEEQLKRKDIIIITYHILVENQQESLCNLDQAMIILKLIENNLSSSADVQIINDNLQLLLALTEKFRVDQLPQFNNLLDSTKTKQQFDKLLDHENNDIANQVELILHLIKI